MNSPEPVQYGQASETSLQQQSRLTDWTWEGSPVSEFTGTVENLFPRVPVFSRHPFRVGAEENRFKDVIRREPLKITDEPIPVATVSKTYTLVQHRDLLASVYQAFKLINIDISGVESSLLLSDYGERMHWSCSIPNVDFDPGDHHPLVLKINCLNSVDTSTVLEITLSWYRLVCSNGLMFGIKEDRLRRRHTNSLDPEDIAAYLREQLDRIPQERSLYAAWYKMKVDSGAIERWVDTDVLKEWGQHAAARVWNIIETGEDGQPEQVRNCKPHEIRLVGKCPVPGSLAPVRNAFHVSQALSWIAGTRNSLPERLEYVKAIPRLVELLLAQTAS